MSPAGKVHFHFWKYGWIFPIVIVIMFFTVKMPYTVSIGVMLGYLLGAIIDPDLDQIGITRAEGRMLKIPIIGYLLVAYWTIYGAIFRKHHRSFWTHGFIVSTVIRFIYQFWWILLFKEIDMVVWPILGGMFIGLNASDSIHIWADKYFGGR